MFLQFVSILANAKIHSSNEWFDDVKHIEDYSDVNLLLAIQVILPKSDSKDIVDRPTKRPLREVMSDFDSIKSDLNLINFVEELLSVERMTKYAIGQDSQLYSSIEKIKSNIREKNSSKVKLLQDFVQRNFHPVGSDIAPAIPPDHNSKPEFLSDLKDEKLIEMSIKLNETWKELSRQTVKIENGGVSTLLDLPHLFIIPGGRFREYYYWDTYWILEGLLVSGMNVTASNIVKNFISIINTYGYIPNGTRKYYLYRSEPPYFTMMLLKLLDIENNKYNDLVLGEGLKAALKEYEFWEKNRKIELKDKDGKKHSLNLYYARTNYPRPESFSEDYFTFEKQDKRDEETIYTNLKSGAESGWDFSCRWLTDPTSIDTIRASEQIPVDLNAILYKNEVILSVLLKRNNQSALAEKFHKKSVKRKEAMNAILWNDKTGSWNDYLYLKNKFVDDRFYFSNIMPLIYGVSPPSGKCTEYDILKKYSQELFGYIGGVPVSGEAKPVSTQQWDFPNAWAPHQHMIVEYLLSIEEEEMAFHCAKSFFNAVYESYKQEKTFFEKYSCEKLGSKGGGGEYELQTGFGWTNGTILSFIQRFGDELMEDYPFSEKLAFIHDILNSKVKEKAANDESTIIRGLNNQIIVSFKSG